MDRSNFYYGQLVSQGELDQVFDDVEAAEWNLALEAKIAQAKLTDSPSSNVFGGIVKGGVVSGAPGATQVGVTACAARDDSGRRVEIPGAATVLVSKTGTTVEGVIASAVGNGADIVSVVPAGQRIIASLYVVYDENLSDSRTDDTGVQVYYRIAESMHFELLVGAAFAHPPAAPPTRAALADGKTLLADVLLTNNAGTMQVVAILTSTAHWVALGGNYASLTGRRSDWLALEPLYTATDSLRAGTSRDAIRGVVIATLANFARVLSGAGVPGSTPSKAGDIYINTAVGDIYIAKAATGAGDWVKVN